MAKWHDFGLFTFFSIFKDFFLKSFDIESQAFKKMALNTFLINLVLTTFLIIFFIECQPVIFC
jgi:hypothetical protein